MSAMDSLRKLVFRIGGTPDEKDMPSRAVKAARAVMPAGAVYADWSARALPLRVTGGDEVPGTYVHPHSSLGGDKPSASELARRALADLVGNCADTHDVVLVSGATDALHKVAERLPWQPGDVYACHTHAHLSLLGIRGEAISKGSSFVGLNTQEMDDMLGDGTVDVPHTPASAASLPQTDRAPFVLLGFPGECNLTGALYPVEKWTQAAYEADWDEKLKLDAGHATNIGTTQKRRIITLVDAAALVACKPIPASAMRKIDLLCCSLYKVTGKPTGLGALFVRHDSYAAELIMSSAPQSYFAGGRSTTATSAKDASVFRPGRTLSDSLELGTANLDAIGQVPRLLEALPSHIGGAYKQSSKVAELLRRRLRDTFKSRVTIHQDPSQSIVLGNGPVVAFSLSDSRSQPIGHREIANVLALNDVHVRAGCMCNPGGCSEALGWTDEIIHVHALRNKRCEEGPEMFHGMRTGVVRASFGWASLESDARIIVDVLVKHFGKNYQQAALPSTDLAPVILKVEKVFLYPVKGCRGYEASEVIGLGREEMANNGSPGGLAGDRGYGIVDHATRKVLRRTNAPDLDQITAEFKSDQISDAALCLTHISGETFSCKPESEIESDEESAELSGAKSSELTPAPFATYSSQWLSSMTSQRIAGELVSAPGGSFTNRGGSIHIVSLSSCEEVASALGGKWTAWDVARATRANAVLAGAPAWQEDAWDGQELRVGGMVVDEVRQCTRCAALNWANSEPLRTVVRVNAQRGRTRTGTFGVVGVVREGGIARPGDKMEVIPAVEPLS